MAVVRRPRTWNEFWSRRRSKANSGCIHAVAVHARLVKGMEIGRWPGHSRD